MLSSSPSSRDHTFQRKHSEEMHKEEEPATSLCGHRVALSSGAPFNPMFGCSGNSHASLCSSEESNAALKHTASAWTKFASPAVIRVRAHALCTVCGMLWIMASNARGLRFFPAAPLTQPNLAHHEQRRCRYYLPFFAPSALRLHART